MAPICWYRIVSGTSVICIGTMRPIRAIVNTVFEPLSFILAMAKAASEQMNTPVGTLSTVRISEFMKYVLMPSRQASVKFVSSRDRGHANVPFTAKSAGLFTAVKTSTMRGADHGSSGHRDQQVEGGRADAKPGRRRSGLRRAPEAGC